MNRREFLAAAGLTGAFAITSQAPVIRWLSRRQPYRLNWFERVMVPARWPWGEVKEGPPQEFQAEWFFRSIEVWLHPSELKQACAQHFERTIFEYEPDSDDRVVWGVQLEMGTAPDDYIAV